LFSEKHFDGTGFSIAGRQSSRCRRRLVLLSDPGVFLRLPLSGQAVVLVLLGPGGQLLGVRAVVGDFQAVRDTPLDPPGGRLVVCARHVTWLAEPVVNGDGPKLVHHTQANCVELTDTLLADVVDRVVAWYDAVESVLIA
jgi:hypothetical protein